MINMLKIQKDKCIDQLENCLVERTMEECVEFINLRRESRHIRTLERQLLKFEQLCHKNKIRGSCSNIQEKQDGCSNIKDDQEDKKMGY